MASRRSLDLTPRQREVLDLLAANRTNYEIAQQLDISLDGAKWHVREVLARLGVGSREEAAELWRRERSPLRRVPFAGILVRIGLAKALIGAGAVVAVAATVIGVAAVRGDPADPPSSSQPVETPAPPADELLPRSDIPEVDDLLLALRTRDGLAVTAMLAATPTGLLDEAAVSGPDLAVLVREFAESPNVLHGVSVAQPDTFRATFQPWKYEVFARTTTPTGMTWVDFLFDDRGVVGTVFWTTLDLTERANRIPPEEWLVAPPALARLTFNEPIYVLGRDPDITFFADLPPACARKPFAIRLYDYPPPGTPGGIQTPKDPAFATELRAIMSASGQMGPIYHLPPTAESPVRLRPGLQAPCLADLVVQGEVNLALLAPPADAAIATIELLGALMDLPRNSTPTTTDTMGSYLRELTASIDGYACTAVSLTDPAARNARGNVVFRIGEADQPVACRRPGAEIVFVMTGLEPQELIGHAALSDRPIYVPGAIQLLRNIGPEPPHREPRPPLIYE